MNFLAPHTLLLFLATGVFSGLAAGLMGVGGGLVNVPALYYMFKVAGYPPDLCFHMALGTSLAIIVFTSLSAARTHHKKGNLILRVTLVAGFLGVVGSFVAALTAINLSGTVLKIAFAVLLYGAAVKMFTGKKTDEAGVVDEMRTETWRLGIIGISSGILAGFFGIGGGLVGVPMFILWGKLPPHKAVGSSSGMVCILGLFGALGYAISNPPVPLANCVGYVHIPAWILVAASSILFAHLGAVIATKASPRVLSIIFACGLLVVATKMLIG